MVTTKSRHHATTPPRHAAEGGGRHGPGGPLPAMGTGGRGPLEAWAETEREREPFTEEESDTEEEEGSVASGAGGGGGGGGGGIAVGGLSVRVKTRRGSIFTQAYDEGLKALLTPQARKLRSKLTTPLNLVTTPLNMGTGTQAALEAQPGRSRWLGAG